MTTGNSHIDIASACGAILEQLRAGEEPDVWLALSRNCRREDRAVANQLIEALIERYRDAPADVISQAIDDLSRGGLQAGIEETLGILPAVAASPPPTVTAEDEAAWWAETLRRAQGGDSTPGIGHT